MSDESVAGHLTFYYRNWKGSKYADGYRWPWGGFAWRGVRRAWPVTLTYRVAFNHLVRDHLIPAHPRLGAAVFVLRPRRPMYPFTRLKRRLAASGLLGKEAHRMSDDLMSPKERRTWNLLGAAFVVGVGVFFAVMFLVVGR